MESLMEAPKGQNWAVDIHRKKKGEQLDFRERK
jgi:hypothetical protein